MSFFQECLFIVRLVFSLKCGWFIRWQHWFGCFLSCTWIRWFIQRCFRQVIWGWWGRGIRQHFDIFSVRMDTFFFLCIFHCGLCSLLVFRNLLLLIHPSVHFRFFFRSSASSCNFLTRLSSLQACSSHWMSYSLSWVLIIASLWRNTFPNPSFDSFIMQKSSEAGGYLFLSGWYWRASLWYAFLIQTNNMIIQNSPSKPWASWTTCWKIIHYIPVWRLSDWDLVLHIYLFFDELLEEIQD